MVVAFFKNSMHGKTMYKTPGSDHLNMLSMYVNVYRICESRMQKNSLCHTVPGTAENRAASPPHPQNPVALPVLVVTQNTLTNFQDPSNENHYCSGLRKELCFSKDKMELVMAIHSPSEEFCESWDRASALKTRKHTVRSEM